MNLADPTQRDTVLSRLGRIFTGRRVICGPGPLAGMTDWVTLLDSVGARKPLLLSTARGAGPVPTEEQASVAWLDADEPGSMTEEARQHDPLLRHLPDRVRTAVEEYDPEREAVWFTSPFVADEQIDGRPVYGGRPRAWMSLEDKLVADRIWDAVGAPRADRRVVPVEPSALRQAHAALDEGFGTVWAGDARDGLNGGGDFVRWVRDEADAQAAVDFFAERCDRVRVMPFLEGVPCSIHGMVLPDGTAAFRPLELAILRGPRRRFVYGGQGTTWDAPAEDRAWMRELVRRAGEHLRAEAGYRGGFGIDGVLTAHGFRPTELNPRMSGGLTSLARAVDWPLFCLLQLNLVAGRDPGVSADELEAWAVPLMDERTFCKAIVVSTAATVDEARDIPVVWDGHRLRPASGTTARASVVIGPTSMGVFAKLVTPAPPERGSRAAEVNVALMGLLDEVAGTDFGEVSAAPDVRREALVGEPAP
jgi:hypothetical protein